MEGEEASNFLTWGTLSAYIHQYVELSGSWDQKLLISSSEKDDRVLFSFSFLLKDNTEEKNVHYLVPGFTIDTRRELSPDLGEVRMCEREYLRLVAHGADVPIGAVIEDTNWLFGIGAKGDIIEKNPDVLEEISDPENISSYD